MVDMDCESIEANMLSFNYEYLFDNAKLLHTIRNVFDMLSVKCNCQMQNEYNTPVMSAKLTELVCFSLN